MAEIDKGLPNTRNKEEIPSDAEVQEVAVQEQEGQDPKGPMSQGLPGLLKRVRNL